MPVEVAESAADDAAPAAELAAEPAAPVAEVRASEAEPAADEAAPDALSAAPDASAAAEEKAPDALAAASEAEPDREPARPLATEKRVVWPMVEVATALPSELMVVRISEVVNGTCDWEMAAAPEEAAAPAPAPPVVTPTAAQID
jgi:chemotaxis protein histidine kinase CheA